jgi:hypothetical protein
MLLFVFRFLTKLCDLQTLLCEDWNILKAFHKNVTEWFLQAKYRLVASGKSGSNM